MSAADWLLAEGRLLGSLGALIEGLGGQLRARDLPVVRLGLHMRALHPQVGGQRVLWNAGEPVAETVYGHEVAASDVFARSALAAAYATGEPVRRRLEGPLEEFDFPILHDLKAEGLTDYLVMPIRFATGETHAASWASRRPGGFTDAHLAIIKATMPALSAVVETHYVRRTMATLLDTYLGREAGRRVLNGSIRRGDGETIAAALFYCDLRGFTELSNRLERDQLLDLLDDFFGCMAGAVDHGGGEVLKFIGDAMLAIFPMRDDLDRDRACLAALGAAERALGDIDRINRERQIAGKPGITAGIGLHAGAVLYGNIGAPARLDFTVTGPAVNVVTRIESLCPMLGRPVLASARFASPCGSRLVSLGRHPLKGIEAAQEIFGLP
ncbi:MAG: adenylate/guanylate cyclase domain-containing protein [Dongiaceae bacterium]